jgi:hypothetical protein
MKPRQALADPSFFTTGSMDAGVYSRTYARDDCAGTWGCRCSEPASPDY